MGKGLLFDKCVGCVGLVVCGSLCGPPFSCFVQKQPPHPHHIHHYYQYHPRERACIGLDQTVPLLTTLFI